MNECTIIEINGKFQIGEVLDAFESRIHYENMAKEDGIKLIRTDGSTPKWADQLVDDFNKNFVSHDNLSLCCSYVYKNASGTLSLVGLVTPK